MWPIEQADDHMAGFRRKASRPLGAVTWTEAVTKAAQRGIVML
jgi:hypothetical protein